MQSKPQDSIDVIARYSHLLGKVFECRQIIEAGIPDIGDNHSAKAREEFSRCLDRYSKAQTDLDVALTLIGQAFADSDDYEVLLKNA